MGVIKNTYSTWWAIELEIDRISFRNPPHFSAIFEAFKKFHV